MGLFFGVQVYNSQNYLEIKKDLGSKFHAPMIQNTYISWSSCFYLKSDFFNFSEIAIGAG